MKTIITEEMRTRQRAIEYAKKYNCTVVKHMLQES